MNEYHRSSEPAQNRQLDRPPRGNLPLSLGLLAVGAAFISLSIWTPGATDEKMLLGLTISTGGIFGLINQAVHIR